MSNNRGARIAVVSALVGVLVAGLVIAAGFLVNVGPASASEQVFLEAVNEVGANPFVPAAGPKSPVSRPNGAPGVMTESAACDAAALVSSLQSDARLASAWTEALNSDDTLRWSGGNTVRPDQVGAYIAELTPQVLGKDVRVTNFQYTKGSPTSVQSVLQGGSSVMVDKAGVVRVRCKCGNPLTPMKRLTAKPVYQGTPWVGFVDIDIIVISKKSCDDDEYWNGRQCHDVDCEDGRYFDGDRCRPVECDDDEDLRDGYCRPEKCDEDDGKFYEGRGCRPVECDEEGERFDGNECRRVECPDEKVRVEKDCVDPDDLDEQAVVEEAPPAAAVAALPSTTTSEPPPTDASSSTASVSPARAAASPPAPAGVAPPPSTTPPPPPPNASSPPPPPPSSPASAPTSTTTTNPPQPVEEATDDNEGTAESSEENPDE